MKCYGLVMAGLLLSACGGEGEVQVHSEETAQEAAQETASDTPIADSVRRPIDRAQAVQDIAASRKQEMDEALAEAEGGEDDDPR